MGIYTCARRTTLSVVVGDQKPIIFSVGIMFCDLCVIANPQKIESREWELKSALYRLFLSLQFTIYNLPEQTSQEKNRSENKTEKNR